jgi:tRNA dimethylallyltransferase
MPVPFSAEKLKRFKDSYNLLVVLGPTASGKTKLAVSLARIIGGEIISADSRQVYRGMDIGTGKDISDYSGPWGSLSVHLLDILDPDEEFSVFAFQKSFKTVFLDITRRGNFPIMAGGTGLYLDSVLRQYRMEEVPENRRLREKLIPDSLESLRARLEVINPSLHNKTDILDRTRAIRAIEIAEFHHGESNRLVLSSRQDFSNISPFVIGIHPPREELRRRITSRLQERLDGGMVEEVRRLHENGVSWERIDALGLEYRHVALYLQGKMAFPEMFELLNTKIHQFAKRQETWFRKMEKNGVRIHWLNGSDKDAALALMMADG